MENYFNLKSKNCKKVLFAGKVKPNLRSVKLDLKGIYYMPKIIKSSKLGDAAILKQIIKILKGYKIQTLKSNIFTPELSLRKGCYTSIKPNKNDKNDINFAINALKKSGFFSHVQGAISRNNKLIAKEESTGTKIMINKIKNIKKTIRSVGKISSKKTGLKDRSSYNWLRNVETV